MDAASMQYLVHSCSMCPGDAEYFCASCSCDLCFHCRENHVNNLKTIDHNVVIRKKYHYMPIQELCMTHPGKAYKKYCERCELPVCNRCRKHRNHRKVVLKKAYKSKVKQYKAVIHTIRCDTLFSRYVLQGRIKAEVKTVQTCFSLCQSELSAKAETLKNIVEYVLFDLLNNVFCDFDFKHRCLKQNFELSRRLARIQRYEYRYEQSATCSLIYSLWKKIVIPKICLKVHTNKLSVADLLHKKGVIDTLCKIKIGGRKRHIGNECLLKLMPSPEIHQSIALTHADGCKHITCVSTDRVWVSDRKNKMMLTNIAGDILHYRGDLCSSFLKGYGLHTVNANGELIYIDGENNINKLSRNLKTSNTFIECTDKTHVPQCVYCSAFNGDLLVAVLIVNTRSTISSSSVVKRYKQSGQLTQTIQQDNKGMKLFERPRCITENNNGDIVVSDWTAVVVTERGGRHRFTYNESQSIYNIFLPNGICTDALSHILVCEEFSNTVQMIDRDGQFLSYLLIRPPGIFYPRSLSYDVNTHRLWVGSEYYNKVCCFRYMARKVARIDLNQGIDDVRESINNIVITGKRQNESPMRLMSTPKLLQSVRVAHVCFYHIACVTSDRIWASDRDKLLLINTNGETLHYRGDLFNKNVETYSARHTVNSDNELFYIHRNNNIHRLSQDEKSTIIIKKGHFWKHWCIFWSTITNDLLVGMYREETWTGVVFRYNQTGQLTQTVQHDSTGLELYCMPNYITENNNGDIIVSDFHRAGAVVVTDREGKHRFTYPKHPQEFTFRPLGICTDAMSHILVCDSFPGSIHILHKDGQFLSLLNIEISFFDSPTSLSYDVKSNCLWVGSKDNHTVSAYRYIYQHNALTGKIPQCPKENELSCSRLV